MPETSTTRPSTSEGQPNARNEEDSSPTPEQMRQKVEELQRQLQQQQLLLDERSTPRPSDLEEARSSEMEVGFLRRLIRPMLNGSDSIDSFSGGPDYEVFIEAILSAKEQNNWSDIEAFNQMVKKLKEGAKAAYYALRSSERPKTVREMKIWLTRIYGRKINTEEGKRELRRCVKQPDETLGAYVQRLKVVSNKAFPKNELSPLESNHRDKMIVDQFLQGIDLRLANRVLENGEFFNVENALVLAETYEGTISRQLSENLYVERWTSVNMVNQNQAGRRGDAVARTPNSLPRDRHTGNRSRLGGFMQKFPKMRVVCLRCGEKGHRAKGCLNPTRTVCYHCAEATSHSTEECTFFRQEASTPNREH